MIQKVTLLGETVSSNQNLRKLRKALSRYEQKNSINVSDKDKELSGKTAKFRELWKEVKSAKIHFSTNAHS